MSLFDGLYPLPTSGVADVAGSEESRLISGLALNWGHFDGAPAFRRGRSICVVVVVSSRRRGRPKAAPAGGAVGTIAA